MNRKDKIQWLSDLQTGAKKFSDLVQPNYDNLTAEELVILERLATRTEANEQLTQSEEAEAQRIIAKLYSKTKKIAN